jgi:hypothetical protein
MSNDNFDQSIPDHSEQILDMVIHYYLTNHFVDINEMVFHSALIVTDQEVPS